MMLWKIRVCFLIYSITPKDVSRRIKSAPSNKRHQVFSSKQRWIWIWRSCWISSRLTNPALKCQESATILKIRSITAVYISSESSLFDYRIGIDIDGAKAEAEAHVDAASVSVRLTCGFIRVPWDVSGVSSSAWCSCGHFRSSEGLESKRPEF